LNVIVEYAQSRGYSSDPIPSQSYETSELVKTLTQTVVDELKRQRFLETYKTKSLNIMRL
jgi:hypothetical protein